MSPKNKLTYIIGLSWNNGAVTKYFKTLAIKLAERGHRVILVADKQDNEFSNYNDCITFYRFPSTTPTHLIDFLFVLKLIIRNKPNCVIGVFRAVNIVILAGWLLGVNHRLAWYQTTSKQSIFEVDKPSDFLRMFQIFRKSIIYKLATKIISSTNAMKKDLEKVYQVPERKIEIFPNSILDPDIAYYGYTKISNQIICAGRLCNLKGQETLIKAVALLKPDIPNLIVLFFGGGDIEYYRSLSRKFGVEELCIFRGRVSHEMIFENMATSSITIVPSIDEAFGYVNIESMCVGTPIIASNVGGIPEVIREGLDGILVPPNDPYHLAKSIKMLLIDNDLRIKMGLNARQRFLDCYEINKIISNQVNYLVDLG